MANPQDAAAGDKDDNAKPSEELLPQVYAELRRLAASKLAAEAPGQTLQPTALVHEAWLRMGGNRTLLDESDTVLRRRCRSDAPHPR